MVLKSLPALLGVAAFVMPLAIAGPAAAEFPERPVTVVVPFNPGGSNDIIGRQLAKQLSELWGQPVVVENRPGAGSSIGTDYVAKAEPDGYTILVNSVTFTMNPAVQRDLPFDPLEDFEPVAMLGRVPLVLGARPDIPAKTPEELFEYIRENPGKLNYAATGEGSIGHFAGELLKQAKDLDIQVVQYTGGAPAMTDVMGSHVEYFIGSMTQMLPHIQNGSMVGIGVTSAERSEAAPDIPSFAESGVEGYDLEQWWGVWAPEGTPEDIVQKLNNSINKVLESEEMIQYMAQEGAKPSPMSPDEFSEFVKQNVERWQRVAQESNIQPQ